MLKLLVTRQEPEATLTEYKLQALGFAVEKQPFTHLVALNPPLPHLQFDAAVITSAAAIQYADHALLQRLTNKPIYCVGEKTRDAALKSGLKTIASFATADQLIKEITAPAGTHFIFLTGRIRRPTIENGFLARNYKLTLLELYDTVETVSAVLKSSYGSIDGVVLYSQKAADIFTKNAEKFDRKLRIFCLSKRIAERLPAAFQAVTFASDPNEASLFEAILKWRDHTK